MTEIDIGAIPDRWLRTFSAACRTQSFTAAAAELGVGQPAVSHAVARLERAVGVRLFDRSPHGIVPTIAGERLQREVAAAFERIDRALSSLVATERVVTISVSSSLATYWLLPRLPEFKREHPEIELRVITTDSDRGVGRDDADLWIPLGPVAERGLRSWHFSTEVVVPVASPELAGRLAVTHPSQLLAAPLLHLEERYAPRFDWSRWFAHHHVDVPTPLAGPSTNDYSLVVHGALDGQGVALGWRHIVRSLVHDRRLVEIGTPVSTGQPFVVVSRDARAAHAPTEKMRRWLTTVAAEEFA